MREVAFTLDISKFYNQTRLDPEHYRFQRCLLREKHLESSPEEEYVIVTLIYGVRSAGNQCQAGVLLLADENIRQGKNLKGAAALKECLYVDDPGTSEKTLVMCKDVVSEILEILAMGGMKVKAVTYSGEDPS